MVYKLNFTEKELKILADWVILEIYGTHYPLLLKIRGSLKSGLPMELNDTEVKSLDSTLSKQRIIDSEFIINKFIHLIRENNVKKSSEEKHQHLSSQENLD